MQTAIAFDVYGTLVDPLAMAEHLEGLVGDQSARFAELWRTKQLEYSFRRGLMRVYRPFSVFLDRSRTRAYVVEEHVTSG
jgi:2-haloacid dehalogenase